MTEPALFLGGPWDGRRDCEQRLGIRITVCEAVRPLSHPRAGRLPDHSGRGVIDHTYRLMQYLSPSAPTKTLTMWVHSEIEDDAIMERLVKGYSEKAFQ